MIRWALAAAMVGVALTVGLAVWLVQELESVARGEEW